jgi:uncharacterized membrane protein YdjX (TVP38/TMEM64 family)
MLPPLKEGIRRTMSTRKQQMKWLLGFLVLSAVIAFFYFDLGQWLSLENLKAQKLALSQYVSAHYWLALLVFFIVYVAVAALSLPGAAILTLAAGAIFGLINGFIVVSFASSLGALLAFLGARFLFRDAIKQRFANQLAPIENGIAKDGAFYLLSLRLVPLFPFFVVNLLMGLTNLPARTFYIYSQLGMIPGTLAFVYAGTQLAKIESVKDVLSPGLLAAFVILGILPIAMRKLLQWLQERKRVAS